MIHCLPLRRTGGSKNYKKNNNSAEKTIKRLKQPLLSWKNTKFQYDVNTFPC